MASSFSEWIWSPEYGKYYCAVYDANKNIIEYQWQGGYQQVVEPAASTGEEPSSTQQAFSSNVPTSRVPRSLQELQQPSSSSAQYTTTSMPSQYTAFPQQSNSTQRSDALSSGQPYYTSSAYTQNVPNPQTSYSASPPSNYTTSSQPYFASSTHTGTLQPAYEVSLQSQSYYTNPSQQQHGTSSQSNHYTYSQTPYDTASHTSPTPGSSAPLPLHVREAVGGDKKSRHIKTGNDGVNYEKLHPSFKRVSSKDHDRFFRPGRVFKMLWTEPAGQVNPGQTRGSTHYSLVQFNEGAWSEIRRFVVIKNKGTFSQCIPIQSYRNQGATKSGLVVEDHAVIYTGLPGAQPPQLYAGEEAIVKQALRVHPINGSESLNVSSRINFGKPYAVEHNVKLAEIGIIAQEHLHLLVTYFYEAMGLA